MSTVRVKCRQAPASTPNLSLDHRCTPARPVVRHRSGDRGSRSGQRGDAAAGPDALGPAATCPARIGEQVATVLTAHDAPAAFVEAELRHMRGCRLGTTANRRVVGVMNEFAHLAAVNRGEDPTCICSTWRCGWPPHPAALCTAGMSALSVNWPPGCVLSPTDTRPQSDHHPQRMRSSLHTFDRTYLCTWARMRKARRSVVGRPAGFVGESGQRLLTVFGST